MVAGAPGRRVSDAGGQRRLWHRVVQRRGRQPEMPPRSPDRGAGAAVVSDFRRQDTGGAAERMGAAEERWGSGWVARRGVVAGRGR